MRIVVLVVAALLIAGGVAMLLRSPVGAPDGRSGTLERAWAVLPLAFLALLIVLSAGALR